MTRADAVANDTVVRPVGADQIGAVGEVMALAFAQDPVTRWLIDDDPSDRQRIMRPYFTMLARLGLDAGVVYVSGAFDSVSVWMDATAPMPAPPDEPDQALVELCGRHIGRFHALDHVLYAAQQHLPPHQHLWFLATRPEHQGRGLGSRVLETHHSVLDRAGVPSYLDASSRESRRLYLRHGYQDAAPPFRPPDGGPPMFPMWRPVGGVERSPRSEVA
jgi:GNAT superfamily N-acetyltransferase